MLPIHDERLNDSLAGLLQRRPLEHVNKADDRAFAFRHSDRVTRCGRNPIEALLQFSLAERISKLAQESRRCGKIRRPKVANDHCAFVLPGPFAATVGAARLPC